MLNKKVEEMTKEELMMNIKSKEFIFILSEAGLSTNEFVVECNKTESLKTNYNQIAYRRRYDFKKNIEVKYLQVLIETIGENVYRQILAMCQNKHYTNF